MKSTFKKNLNVFVSVGTHPQPFTRLLAAIGHLVDQKRIRGKIIIQAGTTHFSNPNMKIVDFLPPSAFEEALKDCSVFITHAGEGNMGLALQYGKPMVVVPRLQMFGEHTNDHQLELLRAFQNHPGVITVENLSHLGEAISSALKMSSSAPPRGYIPRILEYLTQGNTSSNFITKKFAPPKDASIVVATLNGGEPLIKAVKGMLQQNFSGKYEVIVVDDGSFDGITPHLLRKHFSKTPNVKLIFLPRSGVCKARNAGIAASQYDVVVNMDHDDNPEKDWLQVIVSGFTSPSVGAVSAYGHYGGTSTAFRKDLLKHLGGYDEDFFYYREDTDLSFRIIELGFEYKKVDGARWHGDRTLVTPKGVGKILAYTLQRFKYHMNDVLLHKKHVNSKLCKDFLHIKWKFFVDPVEDFRVATGLWSDKKEFALSSPRGMIFLSNNSPLHFVAIVIVGLGYAFAIKWARLAGSIKHGHLLV